MLVTFYYSLIEKIDVKRISLCIFYPLFRFRVTNNSILPYSLQLRAYNISILAAVNDIFLVGAINMIIKPIIEHIR